MYFDVDHHITANEKLKIGIHKQTTYDTKTHSFQVIGVSFLLQEP